MITKEQAVEFLEGRQRMHQLHAEKISKEHDIIEDEVSRVKYNALIDLSNKYGDIAEMVRKKVAE